MLIIIRDLVTYEDITLVLPKENEELDKIINNGHEYIIVDSIDGILYPGTYSSIKKLNHFLIECKENDVDEETLRILSQRYFYDEVIEKVTEGNYTIIDFDFVTAFWLCSDINDDRDKGLVLYEEGYARLPFEIDDSMQDWIRWENLWNEAECDGWDVVKINNHGYLVK